MPLTLKYMWQRKCLDLITSQSYLLAPVNSPLRPICISGGTSTSDYIHQKISFCDRKCRMVGNSWEHRLWLRNNGPINTEGFEFILSFASFWFLILFRKCTRKGTHKQKVGLKWKTNLCWDVKVGRSKSSLFCLTASREKGWKGKEGKTGIYLQY